MTNLTMTALNFQVAFFPREIMHLCKSFSRSYHCHQRKLFCVNNFLTNKCLTSACMVNSCEMLKGYHNSQGTLSSTTPITAENFRGSLTKQQAKELTSKLTSEERDIFLNALQESKSQEDKAGFEGQLAAFRWRSKFGRPSKVPSLGDVDPTGTYCPVPDDWLLRKYVENVPEPSTKVLILVAIANAIPFIGFGFLDNFIMIVAGDQIEMVFNRKFPISTMTAAALGNTVSDIIGIGSVHYVEMFAQKVGFEAPKLTPIQLNLPKTRVAANVGRVIGVTLGCLLGMTPIAISSLLHDNS